MAIDCIKICITRKKFHVYTNGLPYFCTKEKYSCSIKHSHTLLFFTRGAPFKSRALARKSRVQLQTSVQVMRVFTKKSSFVRFSLF